MPRDPEDDPIVQGPFGYELVWDDDMCIPVRMNNQDEFREIMTRESSLSFPAAFAGTAMAGPVGTAAGHVVGSAVGLVRHKKAYPDEPLTEPVRAGRFPERDIEEAEMAAERPIRRVLSRFTRPPEE